MRSSAPTNCDRWPERCTHFAGVIRPRPEHQLAALVVKRIVSYIDSAHRLENAWKHAIIKSLPSPDAGKYIITFIITSWFSLQMQFAQFFLPCSTFDVNLSDSVVGVTFADSLADFNRYINACWSSLPFQPSYWIIITKLNRLVSAKSCRAIDAHVQSIKLAFETVQSWMQLL